MPCGDGVRGFLLSGIGRGGGLSITPGGSWRGVGGWSGQKVRAVPAVVVRQVHQVEAVRRPNIVLRLGVTEENDVGRGEDLLRGLVLGADQNAVLELLGKRAQVLGVLCLGAGDVDADDGLAVIHEGHVRALAFNEDGVVLQDQVAGEAGLPAVTGLIEDPDDLAVPRGYCQLGKDALLPRVRPERLVGRAIGEAQDGL